MIWPRWKLVTLPVEILLEEWWIQYCNYHNYEVEVNKISINGRDIIFEDSAPHEKDEGKDLLVQFAVNWGKYLASAEIREEFAIIEAMQQYHSDELLDLLSSWVKEYLSQDNIEDSTDFFFKKLGSAKQLVIKQQKSCCFIFL